jgi:hypothetical protein
VALDSADRSIAALLADARSAYDALQARAEEVEDEWSYVNDLADAWRMRFDEVEAARGHAPADAAVVGALEALTAEGEAIDDPHRAIDWLSTWPQLLLIALGERP